MDNDIICMGINRGCWDAAQTAGLRIHRADAKRFFGEVKFCGEPIDWNTVAGIDTQTTENGIEILGVWRTADDYNTHIFNAGTYRFDLTQPYFPEGQNDPT